jgi:hypothetical protein
MLPFPTANRTLRPGIFQESTRTDLEGCCGFRPGLPRLGALMADFGCALLKVTANPAQVLCGT